MKLLVTTKVNRLLDLPLFEIIPFDKHLMETANQAYERFGKGRHRARVNYGDLFFLRSIRNSRSSVPYCLTQLPTVPYNALGNENQGCGVKPLNVKEKNGQKCNFGFSKRA